ncbi:MAG: sulfite exporter TauE/SafE family protein [Lentisphaerae bacterium]|nr:sulfite exporter TauE/SafE family protein [Lentisphaerota bacterium]MBT4816268.1 sulfite exporter TauE/SafE family protein [Lentisphaerota bacterium]MBT5608813.1 sulfite exporter TauE/SafE family protein [Lentisphaerota bacterium]MBT7059973.1 sulfite exporter TauE/SafE family protein [Lentisphaerota bacterium]MBT7840299.1 sulfite exporter TauE/SafE family protein [Lentisphaerota bacterium]
MEHWIGFAILGVVAGIVSGCLGVGSGLVLIPALVLLFEVPQKSAQGISLAVMVPMALVGATRYVANPDIKVDLRIAAVIMAGAVLAAFAGSHLAGVLPAKVLKKAFAVFLIIVAARILWPKPTARKKTAQAAQTQATASAMSADQGEGS